MRLLSNLALFVSLTRVDISVGRMDLSLPERAPGVEVYQDMPMNQLPFALYILVQLDQSGLQELLGACNESLDENEQQSHVRLPPQSHFRGGPLRAAFEYHLRLGSDRTFDPTHFLAVTSSNWRADGILLVTLDDDNLECIVDKCTIHAKESATQLVNLQIGNTDWSELKETCALDRHSYGTSSHGHEGTDRDDESHHDDTGSAGREGGDAKGKAVQGLTLGEERGEPSGARSSRDTFDDGAPDRKPPAGFYVGIYVSDKIKFEDVLPSIQPAYGKQPPDDYICRFEGSLEHGPQVIQEACKLHVRRCSANRYLHKNLLIVADSKDASEDGVVLVSLGRHSHTKSKSKYESGLSGDSLIHQHRRIPCDPGKTIPLVCGIANGYLQWAYNHWCFALYITTQIETSEILPLLDRQWYKRRDGEERVISTPGSRILRTGNGTGAAQNDWAAIVRKHLTVCYEQRFRPNFHRQLFICCDNNDPQGTGMLLVHLDWDGNVKMTIEEQVIVAQNNQNVSFHRCPMERIYQTISDIADGKTTWEAIRDSPPSGAQ